MIIKWGDLRSLLQYADKEDKQDNDLCNIDIDKESVEVKLITTFVDQKARDCEITIYNHTFNKPVRLRKSMDLITRLSKEDTNE